MIKYKALLTAIDEGSITKAAKVLGYSQPGISNMIDSLESELELPLLVRSKGNLQLTEYGTRMLPLFKRIVELDESIHALAGKFNGRIEGSINIGAQNSLLVHVIPKAVSMFSGAYPDVTFSIHEYPYGAFPKLLDSGEIDIGFMSKCSLKGLTFTPLFQDELYLIMNEMHPLARYDAVPISALNNCSLIETSDLWNDTIETVMAVEKFTPTGRYSTSNDNAALAFVAENQGVYIMSNLYLSMLPDGVTSRPFKKRVHRTMGFTLKVSKTVSPAMHEFIAMTNMVVAEEMKKNDAMFSLNQ